MFYIIKTNRINQKYLTALLNSKLVAFWLRNKGKMQGNNYQIDKEPLLQIPLVKPTQAQQTIEKKVIKLVDKILKDKAANKNTDKHEAEIDKLIYELYDLTDAKIAIIEK